MGSVFDFWNYYFYRNHFWKNSIENQQKQNHSYELEIFFLFFYTWMGILLYYGIYVDYFRRQRSKYISVFGYHFNRNDYVWNYDYADCTYNIQR